MTIVLKLDVVIRDVCVSIFISSCKNIKYLLKKVVKINVTNKIMVINVGRLNFFNRPN